MSGSKLADAIAGARAFVGGQGRRPTASRSSSSARSAVELTKFSSSTDRRRRRPAHDDGRPEVTAPRSTTRSRSRPSALQRQQGRARVLVLLTDGQDVSSKTSLKDALAAGQAGRACSSTRSESATRRRPRAPLEQMARSTGGAFHGTADSSALKGVYSSISSELRRTWRIDYVTAARPGDKVHLRVSLDPEGAASTDLTVPGNLTAPSQGSKGAPLPVLLAVRRADARAARGVPRPQRGRLPPHGRKGLVGEEPARPARRGPEGPEGQAREGRAPRRVRRALPRDRAGVRPPRRLEEAPAPGSSGPTCRCARSSSST